MKTKDSVPRPNSREFQSIHDELLAKRGAQKRRGITTRSVMITLLVTFGILSCLGIYTWIGGAVTGTEFSPQSFATRSFHYWRLPIIHFRITPTYHSNKTFACETDILQHLPTKLSTTRTFQWHLVNANTGGGSISRGDAEILTQLLEQQHWEDWTNDHQSIAKIVWPVVQQLASRECYWAIPEMLLEAKQLDDADAVQKYIDRQLPIIAQQHATDLISTKEWELAEIALDWVESLDPKSEILTQRDLVEQNSQLDSQLELDRSDSPSSHSESKDAITDEMILDDSNGSSQTKSDSAANSNTSDDSTTAEVDSDSSFD